MANTSTIRNLLVSPRAVVVYATIASDGTEETDMIIYDSSVIASALGIADPLDSTILRIQYSSTTALGLPFLEFDATTDVLAWALPGGAGSQGDFDFREFGGLPNYAGAGKTGDIFLTTTLLEPNSAVTIVLTVRPN